MAGTAWSFDEDLTPLQPQFLEVRKAGKQPRWKGDELFVDGCSIPKLQDTRLPPQLQQNRDVAAPSGWYKELLGLCGATSYRIFNGQVAGDLTRGMAKADLVGFWKRYRAQKEAAHDIGREAFRQGFAALLGPPSSPPDPIVPAPASDVDGCTLSQDI
ncbi:unnamed protein product [Sphagnum jensenii]|uniref:Uncharacterized protein n=1 Tax=Sphagnum jensenii TaxID=128206 RepID=A0ABP1BM92_9BRYO